MVKQMSIIGSKRILDFDVSDLKRISCLYLGKSNELFLNKSKLTKTNEGKWREMVYCILAGSQFPVNKLKIIFPVLFSEYSYLLELNSFKAFNLSERRNEIAITLKKLGYRYHTQKATTIVNTATYFNDKYETDIEKFLTINSDINVIRELLVKDVIGIGIKIASHWLRNIGLPVCTVDVHLRRLLCNLNLSNENPEGTLKVSDFLILENIFREWSEILEMNLGVMQFSVWEYTRDYCAPLNCGECPFLTKCKRGKLFNTQQRQLDLF
ncbi:MAG: hypothetical protein NTZ69_04095 [Bacteroidia bacterium]|nr:hypothetical protein [Bacteroidia bacterium]